MAVKNKKVKIIKAKNDSKHLWVLVGLTTVALGGLGYWYYKKKNKGDFDTLSEELDRNEKEINNSTINTQRPSRFRCSSTEYPLQYGTCHDDVKTLQTYIVNTYKEDIGSSGTNNNGVDGMFGNKTNKAAKKHLQKTSFDKLDIEGMKTAIKMIQR